MKVQEAGKELSATFAVEKHKGALTVTFESRSGKRGAPSGRNSDYEHGIELVLARLMTAGAGIQKIVLHPTNGKEGSVLEPLGYSFPLDLSSVSDLGQLRRAISAAQQNADRKPGAKGGGNPTKRLRIYLTNKSTIELFRLEDHLAGLATRRYWALFANPKLYRIDEAIVELDQDLWTSKGKDIHAGDQVLIWRGKGEGRTERGVVALGDVVSNPTPLDDSNNPFWNSLDRNAIEPRVAIRYIRAANLPLLESRHRDLLPALPVARARGGTVFELDPTVWSRILTAAGDLDRRVRVEDALEALSGQPVSEPTTNRLARGQGLGLSTAEKLAVEKHAVMMAMSHFRAAGWAVEEMGKPYDLHCTMPSSELRVEVKGTTGAGDSVRLTRGEVDHARGQFPRVALFVVSEVKLAGGNPPVASGGKTRIIDPWRIDEGALSALAFEYVLPLP